MATEKNRTLKDLHCIYCGSKCFCGPVVISRGNTSSKLMLVGEAPGAKEEKLALPFVGRSGKLLDKLLVEAGLDCEKDVYITNLVKTRPPNNRAPTHQEISLHLPWLFQQIKLIQPLIIVLIGSSALRAILGNKAKITDLRGTWHNWKDIFLIPIFHPSYLLRNPSRKEGSPFDLTLHDIHEVKKKLIELKSISKSESLPPKL